MPRTTDSWGGWFNVNFKTKFSATRVRVARITLKNPTAVGGPAIWSCPRATDQQNSRKNATKKHWSTLWSITTSKCFNEGWNSADGGNKVAKLADSGGILEPQQEITVEVLLLSAEVAVTNSTYKSYLNVSYVTPARAVLKPPKQTTGFPFHMSVSQAKYLIFPFRLSSLRVGQRAICV